MATHILKCWPNAYDAIESGALRFQWRRDDRGFEVGDVLLLRKWDPGPGPSGGMKGYIWAPTPREKLLNEYTEQRVRVTYILRGMFGVPPDYCVMSIERITT